MAPRFPSSHRSSIPLPGAPNSRGAYHRGVVPRRGRSVWVLMILLLLWSVCLGIGLAQATENKAAPGQASTLAPVNSSTAVERATPEIAALPVAATTAIGTVDSVPPRFQLGQRLYLEACATCHIGIPPQVLPSQTWQQLLQDPQHYGVQIKPQQGLELQATWNYLRTYSRDLREQEAVPYRVYQSRYFKALHPLVEMPTRQLKLTSCATCHPGADSYNFRLLSSEWQNAP